MNLVKRLLPNVQLQPVSDTIAPSTEPLECFIDCGSSKQPVTLTKESPTCWFPRDEAVKEQKSYRSRHIISLPKISPQLLRSGFGSYLKRMHGEVDPNATWTQLDCKLHNQRILVAARFVHFVCSSINISLPTEPAEADRILVNAVGNSVIFSKFAQTLAAAGVAASTEANHAQALVHATNYAKEQLSNKASSADEGALVRVLL